jgi:hypothetical protein
MIRRENRATVEFGTVGVFTKTPVIWVTLPTNAREWKARIDGNVATSSQSTTPALVWGARGNARGRDFWLFAGALYSTDVPLDPTQVRALIIEQHLKEQARLSRAAATAERSALPVDPRRAPIPPDIRSEVWKRDGGRCVNCGSNGNLEFDHVIPVSMGGAHTVRNLQLLCVSCNVAKGGNLV